MVLLAAPVLILLLPGISGFPYPDLAAPYSDLAISRYPYSLYLKQSLQAGRIPLWSPLFSSGAPLAAHPLAGLMYPPGWPALMLPLPLGLNLVAALHLIFGSLGVYRLLRREGLGREAALFGGALFAVLPKLYAHYGAGHGTLLYAVCWTPWLLSARGRRGQAASLALIFLADPRWSAYAGAVWLGYTLSMAGRAGLRCQIARLPGRLLPAAMLAAPLALPLLELTRLTTRVDLTAADILAFSLPPERLLGLFFPDLGGFHELCLYTSQATLALAVVALARRWRGHPVRFWGWTVLLSLVWALGAALPPVAWAARLPILDWLRVPSRALFLTGLACCCLAAHGFQVLSGSNDPQAEGAAGLELADLRRVRLALAALLAASVLLAIGFVWLTDSVPLNIAWGSAFSIAAVGSIGLRLAGRLPAPVWMAAIGFLGLLDSAATSQTLFAHRPAVEVLAEGRSAAAYLAAQPAVDPADGLGLFRVYSPSYSLPQQTAAVFNLQLADGVDPLQLQRYVTFMERASGVPHAAYSVTVPPFGAAPSAGAAVDPATANAAYPPDAARLGLLDVAYVSSEFDLDIPGLEFQTQIGATRIYKNRLNRGRAWVQTDSGETTAAAGEPVVGAARITSWSPERIEIEARGPGVLALAEIAYPGWRVWVDGQSQELLAVDGLLRAVRLSPGTHRITFAFHPSSVFWGLLLCAVGAIWLASPILQRSFGRRRRSG